MWKHKKLYCQIWMPRIYKPRVERLSKKLGKPHIEIYSEAVEKYLEEQENLIK